MSCHSGFDPESSDFLIKFHTKCVNCNIDVSRSLLAKNWTQDQVRGDAYGMIRRKDSMNKRLLQYFGIFLAILATIYVGVSMTINFEGLYTKFHTQIADIGYDAKVASIEVSHFPTPTVVLGGVEIPGVLTAQKLSLKFSIFSILTLNPSISSIDASDVHIQSSGASAMHHENAIVRMFQIFPRIPNTDFKRVVITDKKSGLSENVQSIKIRPNSSFGNITIYWTDRTYTNISYNQKAHLEVKIATISATHKVEFLETYDESLKLMSGTIDYHIDNIRDYINDNYRDLDLLITQIASTEPAHITCDFGPEPDGLMVRNINFISDSIAMTGAADLFEGDKQDVLNLHFTKVDLTKLLKSPDMESIQLSKSKSELKLQSLNSLLNITADNIHLSGFDISNVILKASSDGVKLNISECDGVIEKDGKFNLTGAVTQNQYRSQFNGSVNFSYPDANDLMLKLGYAPAKSANKAPITLMADIVATPIDYKLTNVYAKMGQISANGEASVKLIGSIPRLTLALNMSPIDFGNSQYPIISPIADYFKSLTIDMHDKEYLSKYIPLRKIGYIGNFDIILNNPIIGGQNIDKIHFICDASKGVLDFQSLYYQNGKNHLVGSGKLVSTGLKPVITLRVTDGEITTDDLSLGNILSSLNKASTTYGFDKVTLDVALTLKNLTQGSANFKNFYVAAINDGNLFNISALQGYYNTGNLTSSGSIFLDSMTLSLAYAYSNFNINDLNSIYPMSVFGIKDGWVSSNGVISASGETVDKFIYSLYSKSDIVASTVEWYGFDIDGFVDAVSAQGYNKANTNVDAKKFASSGVTNISKITGGYEIDHGVIKFTDATFTTKHTSCSVMASYNIYNSVTDATMKAIFSPLTRDVYHPPQPIEVVIHASGNIASPTRDVTVGAVKREAPKKVDLLHKKR